MAIHRSVGYQSLLALNTEERQGPFLFARKQGGVRSIWGVAIAKNTCIWKDFFETETTLYKSERAARLAQPKDTKTYEPTEVVMVGKGKWINSCVALRDGCLSQMANIPDRPGEAYNARLRWDRKNCAMSLWSTKTIYCEEIRVSSYGRQANRHARRAIPRAL